MAVIFKVGEQDEMASVPHRFPTCGSWKWPEDVPKPTTVPPQKTTPLPRNQALQTRAPSTVFICIVPIIMSIFSRNN